MFGMFEDNRTPAERQRDLEFAEKKRAEDLLALGFVRSNLRPLFIEAGAEVGLPKHDLIMGAELLVEVDGVIYKINVSVNNED